MTSIRLYGSTFTYERVEKSRSYYTETVWYDTCLLYTSDAADERSSVDLGGRRIIKKKKKIEERG